MDDRVALRQAPPPPASHEGALMHEPEENEDEKVYYGFGVFMGLPLADLKAMKDDFLQKQAQSLARGEFRAALPASAVIGGGGGMAPRNGGIDYDVPRGVGPSRVAPSDYNSSNGRGGGGVAPPIPPPNGRAHPMAPHPGHAHYGVSMGAPRPLGRAYDASNGDEDEDGALSDEGSDGSYSAPKSHSLNFILH